MVYFPVFLKIVSSHWGVTSSLISIGVEVRLTYHQKSEGVDGQALVHFLDMTLFF